MPTIIEMVSHTRLDCVHRRGGGRCARRWRRRLHHARTARPSASGCIDQPLMQNVLADLALESEAATATMVRLARAYDEAQADGAARRFARLATAVGKYWVCKRAPAHAAEALECLGGNGYVEESMMPRLYREAPLNGDLGGLGQRHLPRRAARDGSKDPESVQLFFAEVRCRRAGRQRIEHAVGRARARALGARGHRGARAPLVERMALALQASLLVRVAPPARRRRVLRLAPRRRPRPRLRHPPPRRRHRRHPRTRRRTTVTIGKSFTGRSGDQETEPKHQQLFVF